jgi:sugar phosphate isomerase/epimerase
MRFAFSSNAFRRHSLFDTIRILSGIGYRGIEIMADVPHAYPNHLTEGEIRDIRNALDDAGLEISNINAFMHHADGDTYHPSWIELDPALRAKRVDYTLRCIDLAKKLGAHTLSTEPGGPLVGMTPKEGLLLFKEGLLAVTEHAREQGIQILIEPEPGLLIENSRQFLSLFSELDQDVFGLNCDIGHFYCVGEDPVQIVQELKQVIHHFHLEDIPASRRHFHLMPGEGAVDLPHVLKAILEIGYQGFVTIELYTYEEQAEDAARRAYRYLRDWQASNDHPGQRP